MPDGTSNLVRYDAMRMAIAEAHAVDEVKDIRDKALALEIYARQAQDIEAETRVREIRLRAERRAGEMLRERDMAKGGRPTETPNIVSGVSVKDPTLADLGVSYKQSSDWQKLAEVPEEEFEAALSDPNNAPSTAGIIAAHNHRAQGSGENEWYTPREYIDSARAVMGGIDLDPASSEMANGVVRAIVYHSMEDDGLLKEWGGRVWLNPPYAQPHIMNFITKMTAELSAGHVEEAIVLTHNYTDTAWFHLAAEHANAICFTRGRIGFLSPSGQRAAPTQGQAFFYFGSSADAFAEEFERYGLIMVRHAG